MEVRMDSKKGTWRAALEIFSQILPVCYVCILKSWNHQLPYDALGKSILESAAIVWNPKTRPDCYLTEKVQIKFLKFLFDKTSQYYPYGLYCPAKEKWGNSRFFINRVHGFYAYVQNVLYHNTMRKCCCHVNSIAKSGKTKWLSHYFWKKLSKLDVSQNTSKKWTISIKNIKILGKSDASLLKSMRYDFFAYHSDKIRLNCLPDLLQW